MTLQQLLKLTRPLFMFDLETTGPNPKSDRIVEIAFMQFNPDETTRQWRSLVDPEIPIPPASTEKHGIDDARIRRCNRCGRDADQHPNPVDACAEFCPVPTFGQLAPSLLRGFVDCDFAGFNIKTFDLPCLQAEFSRVGHPTWSFSTAKLVDGLRLWQLAEPRTLTDFIGRWAGLKHEGAHHAHDDVIGTVTGIIGILNACQPILPWDIVKLHEMQYPHNPDAIDPDGKIVWKNGVATFNFGTKYRDLPLHKATRRDLEWLAGPTTAFSVEFKAICRNALAGKLPQKPADNQEAA